MNTINTLTVNGQSYALPDPRSVLDDSTQSPSSTWSSRKIAAVEEAASIVCDAAGGQITLTDASSRELQELTLYGKTTQNGTPTPETPVPLESAGAGGSIGVAVAGKNLMRNFRTSDADMVSNGITFTTNRDGTFTANGVNDGNGASTLSLTPGSNWLYLPKGTYTAFSNLTVAEVGYFMLALYDKPSTSSTLYGNFYSYNTPETFTLEKGKFAWMCIRVNTGCTADALVFRPQIELGTAATAYEPYSVQTLTVSTPNGLPGIPVRSGGNYTDENGQQWICDEIDFARGVYIQRIKKIVLDGDETFGAETNNGYRRIWHKTADADLNYRAYVLCSHFKGVYGSVKETYNNCWITSIGYLALYLSESMQEYNTAQAKAWLAENPVTALYILAAPIETALSAEELASFAALHSNKTNTTVFNDSGAGMKLRYTADTKAYIDNKFNELAAAIVNNT